MPSTRRPRSRDRRVGGLGGAADRLHALDGLQHALAPALGHVHHPLGEPRRLRRVLAHAAHRGRHLVEPTGGRVRGPREVLGARHHAAHALDHAVDRARRRCPPSRPSTDAVPWSCSPAAPSSTIELDDSSTDCESERAEPVMLVDLAADRLHRAGGVADALHLPGRRLGHVPGDAREPRRLAARPASAAAATPPDGAAERGRHALDGARRGSPSSSSPSMRDALAQVAGRTRSTSRASARTVSATSRETSPRRPPRAAPPSAAPRSESAWRARRSAAAASLAEGAARAPPRARAPRRPAPAAASSSR